MLKNNEPYRYGDAGRVIDVLREAKAGRVELEIVLNSGGTCPIDPIRK